MESAATAACHETAIPAGRDGALHNSSEALHRPAIVAQLALLEQSMAPNVAIAIAKKRSDSGNSPAEAQLKAGREDLGARATSIDVQQASIDRNKHP